MSFEKEKKKKTSQEVNMSLKLAKAALRKEIKEKLGLLTEEEISKQTKNVLNKLFSCEQFVQSKRVSVYLSMKHEIRTEDILKHLFETKKECFIPKYRVGGAEMDMVQLYSMQDFENLPLTKWKIKQPSLEDERPEALETGGLDVIIAPGVAFTKEGIRLGHGRGYYDSYLQRCSSHLNKKPFAIGLALKEQIVKEVPAGPADIPIDLVLVDDD